MRTRNSPTKWKDWEVKVLVSMTYDMMNDYGNVDMGTLAHHTGHSIASCHGKLSTLGVKYKVRIREPYVRPEQRKVKEDMINMPLHKNGKQVWYDL